MPAVRLMIEGRSVNGWTELTEKSADEFARNAAEATVYPDGFSWLDRNGHAVDTYIGFLAVLFGAISFILSFSSFSSFSEEKRERKRK